MRLRAFAVLFPFACCLLTSCGVNILVHDQASAAATASQAANLAFVRADMAAAHALLAPQMQQALPAEKLLDAVAKLHPTQRPAEVSAIEFEPLPGQAGMNIYLKGTGGNEEFYYRFLMVGDKRSGYRVAGFWRGSGPYPPNARRPL